MIRSLPSLPSPLDSEQKLYYQVVLGHLVLTPALTKDLRGHLKAYISTPTVQCLTPMVMGQLSTMPGAFNIF